MYDSARERLVQGPLPVQIDLRDMLRRHIVGRSLGCLERAAKRRRNALQSGDIDGYRQTLKAAVREFYGELPAGRGAPPPSVRSVSSHDKEGYRVENVLFESFPGWEVNASVYVPAGFAPPFHAVVVPVGHSGKQYENYQLPAQMFARCGYLAVLFDPPGQDSEKQPGNDHFIDGVRPYLIGETSSRYFIADALRCIDYLATRPDVTLDDGVAMTGVSGGGVTTIFSVNLDDRIAVIGPSCCLSPLADLDVTQCYSGCPETHMWRRYAQGVDSVDLLCAASPMPTLMMAGKRDEVFRVEDTTRLAEEVKSFFLAQNAGERFQFFVDESGHGYSLRQARAMVRFMDRWLRAEPDRSLPDWPDESFTVDPYDELKCHPRTDVNMRTLTRDRAAALANGRDRDAQRIRRAARGIAGVEGDIPAPPAELGDLFRVWTHHWQQPLLEPEQDIALPATFVIADEAPAPSILHFDDEGRNHLIYRNGLLTRAIRFADRERAGFNLFSADLRGWGDTRPAIYPYEMTSWGGVDRCLAYMSAALGDPVMSMRIRDGLSCLAYLRSRPEVAPDRIVVTGCGLGAMVALHVAAIADKLAGVVVWDGLADFMSLIESREYVWPADAFVPHALLHYDLPDLAQSISAPTRFFNPLGAKAKPLPQDGIDRINSRIGRDVYTSTCEPRAIVEAIQEMLEQ